MARPTALLLVIALLAPISAVADDDLVVTEGSGEPAPPPPDPALSEEDVELDQLLQLPSTMSFGQEKRNGVSREVWRARFKTAQEELEAAQQQLLETRKSLDEMAGTGGGGQWQMAPPGSNNTEVTPMSFKLREEIREGKERVAEAERKHRALVIQADLAGVPEAWRAVN